MCGTDCWTKPVKSQKGRNRRERYRRRRRKKKSSAKNVRNKKRKTPSTLERARTLWSRHISQHVIAMVIFIYLVILQSPSSRFLTSNTLCNLKISAFKSSTSGWLWFDFLSLSLSLSIAPTVFVCAVASPLKWWMNFWKNRTTKYPADWHRIQCYFEANNMRFITLNARTTPQITHRNSSIKLLTFKLTDKTDTKWESEIIYFCFDSW